MTDSATIPQVRAPIILVGCPRSGTTLLGRLFAAHPDVAYWEEPRPIWSLGNESLPDDVLDERRLTPRIARRIDGAFHRFLKKSGKSRFAEKTPSNLLRLRFIHALYPDCRIIHILRDGRPAVASMLERLSKPPRRHRVWARLRETPLSAWPALVPLFFRDVIARRLRGGRKAYWGPRPPGWKEWLSLPPERMVARQWRSLMEIGLRDLHALPPENWIEIHHDDLLRDFSHTLPKLLEFASLPPSDEVMALAKKIIDPDRAGTDAWTLSPALQEAMIVEAGHLLEKLDDSALDKEPFPGS